MFPQKDELQPFLNQAELAIRWKISEKTLERWRYEGKKPSYVKLHGRVLYRREDILAFEAECHRQNTSIPSLECGYE